jgi:hypothetical protein
MIYRFATILLMLTLLVVPASAGPRLPGQRATADRTLVGTPAFTEIFVDVLSQVVIQGKVIPRIGSTIVVWRGPGHNPVACVTDGAGQCGFYLEVGQWETVEVHFSPFEGTLFSHEVRTTEVPTEPTGMSITEVRHDHGALDLHVTISNQPTWEPRLDPAQWNIAGCFGFGVSPRYIGPQEFIREVPQPKQRRIDNCYRGTICPIGDPSSVQSLAYPGQPPGEPAQVSPLPPLENTVMLTEFLLASAPPRVYQLWSTKQGQPIHHLYDLSNEHLAAGYLVALSAGTTWYTNDGIGLFYEQAGVLQRYSYVEFPPCPGVFFPRATFPLIFASSGE